MGGILRNSKKWLVRRFPPTTFVIIINWKCIGLLAALAKQFLDAAEGAKY